MVMQANAVIASMTVVLHMCIAVFP